MQRIEPQYILGVDISNHQGDVNMSEWRNSGIQFVYAKATEGVTFNDPFFANNVAKAKSAGIPVGAYHFARPSVNRAVDEAKHFCSIIAGLNLDLDPVLDLEDTKYTGDAATILAWVHDFVAYVKEHTGRSIIIYTGSWYAQHFGNLSGFRLWNAWYPADNLLPSIGDLQPADYGGWTQYTMWQFRSDGAVPGVQGNVDMSYAVSLEAMGYKASQPAQPLLSVDDFNIIYNRWISRDYDLASGEDKVFRHRIANVLRVASGQDSIN